MAIYEKNFSEAFCRLLNKSGVTCYQIHQYTHLDQAYLSRLKNGVKNNPSPETIMKISLGICHFAENIKLSDIEDLFNAVGRSLLSIKY